MEKHNLWTLYTSLQGRISKRTFLLWFFLPIAVTQILAALIDTALYPPNNLSELGGPWETTAAAVTGSLALIYTLYLLIPCCFRPGIGGPNEYGEDPLVN